MPLKFYFELHLKLCVQTVDYNNARCWYNGKTTTYLNPSTCRRVYILPLFDLYDKVLRTHPFV